MKEEKDKHKKSSQIEKQDKLIDLPFQTRYQPLKTTKQIDKKSVNDVFEVVHSGDARV